MSKEALRIISDAMSKMGLNYEFVEWTSEPAYPYFTGEYQEVPSSSEDGEQETSFILNGFARDAGGEKTAYLELENAKEKIAAYFPKAGGRTFPAGRGEAAVFYENSLVIPTGDMELKRLQVNLTIKEWSVN